MPHPRNDPHRPARAAANPCRPVLRGEVLPERIPASDLIILRDGKPGEAEVTLSPLTWFYEHRAELEVVIQAGSGRDALFDALTAAIGAVIAADRTLGGLCDWVEAEAPAPDEHRNRCGQRETVPPR